MKRQLTLYQLVGTQKKTRSESESEKEEEEEGDLAESGVSGTSLQSRASLGTEVPLDIAQTRQERPVQPKLNLFPKTQFGERARCFSTHWYTLYPFLEYSTLLIVMLVACFHRHLGMLMKHSHE